MAKYKIDITSYAKFRAATIGKTFDVDGAYGNQCWDGAALLWQQLGRTLSTDGTGAAKGCWEVASARSANAGKDFDLITDVKKIKKGDVIVFGKSMGGGYGHIAFADADYKSGSKLATYGQNQGGTSGKGTASAFCVKKYDTAGILGAFRFKKWHAVAVPTKAAAVTFKSGQKVKLKKAALYAASTSKDAVGTKTGTFYIWNAEIINGRVRVTSKKTLGGVAGQVTGWVKAADCK